MKQYRANKASHKGKEEQNEYKNNYRVTKKGQIKEKGLEFHTAKLQKMVSQGPSIYVLVVSNCDISIV